VAASSRTLKQKAYREMKEFLLIALYLWLVFGMFITYKAVILAKHQIDFEAHGIALLNALALGKVILIARAFHLGDLASDAPLIYPTLWKSAIFSVLLACFKILEDVVIGFFHGRSVSGSLVELFGGTWKGLLAATVFLFVVLIPFFGFGELQRVLGEGTLGRLFFRSRDAAKPVARQVL
jgi:hypothetical protein